MSDPEIKELTKDEMDFLLRERIDELDFKHTNYNMKSIFFSLRTNETVKKLRLNGMEQRGEELGILFESLKENKSIVSLELNYYSQTINNIFQKLADSLNFNKHITSLDLISDNLNEKSIFALSDTLNKNKTLKELNLSGNKIEGIINLSQSLSKNKTLKKLYLSENNLQETQSNCFSMA
jgi:hypothetical protein